MAFRRWRYSIPEFTHRIFEAILRAVQLFAHLAGVAFLEQDGYGVFIVQEAAVGGRRPGY